jgi:opacity protein-like surface antigen
MKRNMTLLIGAILFAGLPLAAQENTPKAQLELGYSYARFSPSVPQSPSRSLNGGSGAFTYVFNRWWGIKADLAGYGSQTAFTTFAPSPGLPNGGTVRTSGNLFTYLFGPEITYRTKHVTPFAEVLLGGAHSSVFANLYQASGMTGGNGPSQNSFALATGGGVDIYVTKSIAIRAAQLDYLMTRFTNPFTGTNNQNSFRYQAGVVFTFGGR